MEVLIKHTNLTETKHTKEITMSRTQHQTKMLPIQNTCAHHIARMKKQSKHAKKQPH